MGIKAFSLVEMVLAMVILSAGIISVQKVFINSMSAVGIIESWGQAESLLEKKVWEIKRAMKEEKDFSLPPASQGILSGGYPSYSYDLTVRAADEDFENYFMEVKIVVSWRTSGMRRSLTRYFYLMVPYAQWK